jgi:hypothetical protein
MYNVIRSPLMFIVLPHVKKLLMVRERNGWVEKEGLERGSE